MPARAHLFTFPITLLGLTLLAAELGHWESQSAVRLFCYLLAGIAMARLRTPLSIGGAVSVSFLFILFGITELKLPETLLLAAAITVAEGAAKAPIRQRLLQVSFNVAAVVIAIVGA